MPSADKFGVLFTIGFTAVFIGIVVGLSSDVSISDRLGVEQEAFVVEPLTPSPPPPEKEMTPVTPETITTPFTTDNLTGILKYTIRGGIVDSITNNPDENSVTVMMDNRLDGQLTITIITDAITPFDDGSYFVTIDGEENHDFVQVGQRLTIDFLVGSEEIMIFGISDKAAADKAVAPMSADVDMAPGSGAPGCEETDECYIPADVTITIGGTVTWKNADTASHTVTSGTPASGPSGEFDSSLVMVGGDFSYEFEDAGKYDYFCMVHPWMQGTVIVE